MRIAICDDEQKELLYLQNLVKKHDAYADILLFLSAESMLNSMENQQCDLVLLDIEMDEINGFAAAKKLVGMHNPPLIVFVTNSREYTYRGYEVAFRYLLKPVNYSTLSDVLSAAKARVEPYKLKLSTNGYSHIISIYEISHFESFGHNLVVHTKASEFTCKMKMSEVEALLPDDTFAAPHKSYLVNLDFVNTIGENELSLIGEIRIPISRRYKQQFENTVFKFVRRRQ